MKWFPKAKKHCKTSDCYRHGLKAVGFEFFKTSQASNFFHIFFLLLSILCLGSNEIVSSLINYGVRYTLCTGRKFIIYISKLVL